jgi:hypothetical protein
MQFLIATGGTSHTAVVPERSALVVIEILLSRGESARLCFSAPNSLSDGTCGYGIPDPIVIRHMIFRSHGLS